MYQSHVDGNPLYRIHKTKWIKNNVTEKSNTFLDFSTITAIRTDLLFGKHKAKKGGKKTVEKSCFCSCYDTHPPIDRSIDRSIHHSQTHPHKEDNNTAMLSGNSPKDHILKYLSVNIRSIVMEVPYKAWLT